MHCCTSGGLFKNAMIHYLVPGIAPRFTIEPEDRVVVAQRNNENVIERFPCSFDGSNITVTWYHNDVVVPADSSHIIHDNGTLEVTAIVAGVDATIAGVRYHCVLSNEVSSIRSRPALIQLACKLCSCMSFFATYIQVTV